MLIRAGFGKRQAQKIVEAITDVKVNKIQLLASLGIHGWGKRMFETLFDSGNYTAEDIIKGTIKLTDLVNEPGIGQVRTNTLITGLTENTEFLKELIKRIELKNDVIIGNALKGKTFLVTGILSKDRDDIKFDITSNGGKIKSGISSKLDYLVVGDNPGQNKLIKASELNIKTISEKELNDLINT